MAVINNDFLSQFQRNATALIQVATVATKNALVKGAANLKNTITAKVGNFVRGAFSSPVLFVAASNTVKVAFAIAEKEISTLRQRKYMNDVEPLVKATLALQNAPNLEAYFEILAQDVSYCAFDNGTALPPSQNFTDMQFKVQKTLQFPCGMKALIVTSEQAGVAPLMVFRGTDASNIHNLADDVNHAIGELNCKRYATELENELEALAIQHGRVHIMGHSYGGAVAEHLTSKHPHLVQRCTSYNSPGCGKEAIDRFNQRSAELPQGYARPQIVSFRHAKDITSLLGGGHLPTDPNCNFTYGRENDGISYIEAHSFNTQSVPGCPVAVNQKPSQKFAKFAAEFEKVRMQLSRGIPLYKLLAGL